jgi:PPOX class probable F420-dependent enzyme
VGVSLTADEAWAVLRDAHTGIMTTFRKDGRSVPVPTWFVVMDKKIWIRSRGPAAKVRHIRRDPRVSFLVESGYRWQELSAVIVQAIAREVLDPAAVEEFGRAMDTKYGSFRTSPEQMPRVTADHYAPPSVVFALDPVEEFITWDNAKIRLRSPG